MAVNQTMNASNLDQLPEAARDRIGQLRVLFVERSKGHLVQIQEILDERKVASDPRARDGELVKLAHSLVGAAGIFGFQDLGDIAFKAESLLRETGYSEEEFAAAIGDLNNHLTALD